MNLLLGSLLTVGLALAAATASATAGVKYKRPSPGEYVTEQGWGVLSIDPAIKGVQRFSLEAVGANQHVCIFSGSIRADGAATVDDGYEPNCTVAFAAKPDGVEVTGGPACQVYCGARASFPGLYLKPKPGCAPSAVAETRKRFKVQFDSKQFASAEATLKPVLACEKILRWHDASWVRNDLALTQHKLGDQAGCLATLKPLFTGDEEELGFGSGGPSDDAINRPIEQALRTNFKLCGGKMKTP